MVKTIEIDLEEFNTPNVLAVVELDLRMKRAGLRPPKFSLRELTPDTLDALCNKFRQEIFAVAGVIDHKVL